jgi:FkbM family methyltransferase
LGRAAGVKNGLSRAKNLFIFWFSKTGLTFLRTRTLVDYLEIDFDRKKLIRELRFIDQYGMVSNLNYADLRVKSQSQLGQDLWVLFGSSFKRDGTFMEIGAADGKSFSNTYLLEKEFGWKGVIVEPAQIWHQNLKKNRDCAIDMRCCTSESGVEVDFLETPSAMLSTIERYKDSDTHAHERKKGSLYKVKTVSLNDLFEQYFPNGQVDYLSIDTEGNEEEILRNLDFTRFSFKFASIENAFDIQKSERIHALLIRNGYKQVLQEVSEFDDYYERCQ